MDKKQIQQDLVAHLRAGLLADEQDEAAQQGEAQVDETDSHRVDDVSHEDQAGDLNRLIERVDAEQDEAANAAEKLDMSATDTVRPGAVIELDGEHYVVGVASSAFVSGGVEYSGISTDAPIFATLQGKRAGETFTFADTEHSIGAVD